MEATTAFDLNLAIRWWMDRLRQSQQMKAENLGELESHIRDSVEQLQIKGLTVEESFWIAVQRAGTPTQLGPEFGKINRNWWNILAHVLILALFSVSCWFLWGLTRYPEMMTRGRTELYNPAFSRFIADCNIYLIVPPALAAVYCGLVCFRRSMSRKSWVAFLATNMSILLVLMLVVVIAVFLPVIAYFQSVSIK
jgi:hypothetical protein